MNSSLAQDSLLLGRTVKPSSGYGSEGKNHGTICWLSHLSEPDTMTLILSAMWEVNPFHDYGVAMWLSATGIFTVIFSIHWFHSKEAQVLLLPSLNEWSFQRHLLFLSLFLCLVSLVCHEVLKLLKRWSLKLLLRKSGELLEQGVVKGTFFFFLFEEKGTKFLTTSDFVSENKMCPNEKCSQEYMKLLENPSLSDVCQ